ncbi:MAG TPA: 16S rRNA (uracil(1498)-N(3))-methyltransferase [Marinobacterium sp.]|nr:16S rRNA (uracil(1498)-N(3))-methyltransferase [Marinobacterium sp.]
MNLLLLDPKDFISETDVQLVGRRLKHMLEVQHITVGDSLRCGLLDKQRGVAKVLELDTNRALLRVELNKPAPLPLPLILVMALPRPKMLKRILQTSATLGIKQIFLINTYRVDKSYWSTPILQPPQITEYLRLGLEQAGDTLMPQVHLRKRFKPFVEDELPALVAGRRALIAHPYDAAPCPAPSSEPTLVAVGPEGGFIPYEVALMQTQGLTPFHLGERILRVETAVPVIASRLFPLI